MIENTFQILPKVGAKKEKSFWSIDIKTWNDFIVSDIKGIKPEIKERWDSILNYAYELLDDEDVFGLANLLKKGEEWRLYNRFKEKVAYLDIETDGLERDSTVTVVTIHKPKETVTLINGFDLSSESLSEALEDCSMVVTFNGSCFDVPVLRYSFPDVDLDLPHFDLRFGCRKVGLTGGLKNIERHTGIGRSDDIAEVDGFEAVVLWKRWTKYKDQDALDKLVKYNVEDTVNLEPLAQLIYPQLVRDYAGFI